MKKVLEYLGLFAILIFSFYYTNKAAILARNANPIMKNIIDIKDSKAVSSIDAIINDDYIIPGLNGLVVNELDSFNKMRPYNIFNEYYLVYEQISPKISLENNKDKIIINGNKEKKAVSLIIDNKDTASFLDQLEVKYSFLVDINNYVDKEEVINNEYSKFNELDKELTKKEKNKGICLVNGSVNLKECKKKNYYLVEAKELNKSNLVNFKKEIENGSIIKINKDLTTKEIETVINYIKSKGLNIVYLSELISEKNTQ